MRTPAEARRNLVEASELFVISCVERGTLDQALKELGFVVKTGTFVWKFTLAGGQTTANGTISAHVEFQGTPSSQKAGVFIGTSSVFTPNSGPNYSGYNATAFSKVNISSSSATYGSYVENLSLNVPIGVSEFYVVMSDNGSSARFALNSLTVNIATIPEPSTWALMAFSLLATIMVMRRRVVEAILRKR